MTKRALVSLSDIATESRQRLTRLRRKRALKFAGLVCGLLLGGYVGGKAGEVLFGPFLQFDYQAEQGKALSLLDQVGYDWVSRRSVDDLRVLLRASQNSVMLMRLLTEIPDRQSWLIPLWLAKPTIGREESIALMARHIALQPVDQRDRAFYWINRIMSTSGLVQDALYGIFSLPDEALKTLADPRGPLLGTARGRSALLEASRMTELQLDRCKAAAALTESDWQWAAWVASLSSTERTKIVAALTRHK